MINGVEKSALVLAGGGLTGAVYEIGALRAIDDMLIERSVNDFDIYVGTSAGSLIASMLANKINPETMLKVIDGTHPEIQSLKREHIFGINYRDWIGWGARLPGKLVSAWYQYLRNLDDMTLFDLLWSLTEVLPTGLYDGMALDRFIRNVLEIPGYSNRFDQLDRELYIIATNLDTGERTVFGPGENRDIPISLAVAASSALPLVYKPLRIGNDEYVDGGLRGNASLDLAIEQGATLVVCINPMVPYKHHKEGEITTHGSDLGFLSQKGIRSIADQTLRITGHSGLQYHIKQLRRRHPEVDIILIEPRPDDYQMFFYNIMRYSARLVVARHGFESVTLGLAADYPIYKEILARHGISISRRFVIEELAEISSSNYDPEIIRKVMEAHPSNCVGQKKNSVFCKLDRTLGDLENTLTSIAPM
jgi:predicted acylesterase/phospholipase RssA